MEKQAMLIGIDVGGTFTDVIALVPANGQIVASFKVPSTPDDPAAAVIDALQRLAGIRSLQGATVCHGTTVGTNTLIQRKGARVGLLTTAGFTDIIELRRQDRPTLYHLAVRVSEPLVPHERRFGADERLDACGRVVQPLMGVDALLDQIRSSGADAFAISCLHAYANPTHEVRLAEALKQAFPGRFISVSHDVCPEFREYERTSTTVVNAYIGPAVQRYVRRLDEEAHRMGIRSLMVVKSNGGLTSPDNAQRYPVHLIESGPAAGMIATQAYARATRRPNLIAFDMGGTTAKAGVIHDFQPRITDEFRADRLEGGRDVGGYPIRSAVLDIVEVGAGGGSVAWIDPGGVPKVGPDSAGADPGPACYGRGGDLPTVTDAHAVIGTLTSETFAGTGIHFSRDAAVDAIERHIARPMGWPLARAAHAIIEIAVANMTEMVRLATVRRGYDPREFAILASGGAGPLHAALVGAEVGVREVLVPPQSGIFSALGAVLGEVRHDVSATLLTPLEALDPQAVADAFEGLATKAAGLLAAESADPANARQQRFADLRFVGQLFELRVPLGEVGDPMPSVATIEARFRTAYRGAFGFDLAGSRVELVNVHLVASLPLKMQGERLFEPAVAVPDGAAPRQCPYMDRDGHVQPVALYHAQGCAGQSLQGPALIDHSGSTIWVPQGTIARVQVDGSVVFRLSAGRKHGLE
ncbi:hydantoinase/oxoprolinase family protein [Castellaniella sp.]|uniref:hydantoinase/oxoprolinase family protein n=1 Tax=Castellaniella sp. TaxID=1955812 RepID=UPI00355D0C00